MTVAELTENRDGAGAPERAWAYEEFEVLTEDEVVGVLLRRMRALVARGCDPTEALIGASRATQPIF